MGTALGWLCDREAQMTTPVTPGTQLRFFTGDTVAREDDPAHEGEVVAQFDWTVRVLWRSLNAKEDVPMGELVLVKRKRKQGGGPTARPATVVESPRAKLERWMREGK